MSPRKTVGLTIMTATVLAGMLTLGACGATAQGGDDRPSAAPSPPSDAPTAPGRRPGEPQSGSSSPPGSLSRELDRSGGVIEPPAGVDPGMRQPAPPTGATPRTPVIPPPGTPGGDPSVKPK